MPPPHTSSLVYPFAPDSLPPRPLAQPPYLVTFANSPEDLDGVRAYRHLTDEDHLHAEYIFPALPGYECKEPASVSRLEDSADAKDGKEVKSPIPQLFRTYLRYGAKVCGPPVIDRQFGTIDFFMMLDVQQLAPAVFEAYFQSTPI